MLDRKAGTKILTYDRELRILTKQHEILLGIFESEVLRNYRPVREEGEWHMRMNYELKSLIETLDIMVRHVKSLRIS